MPLSLRSALLLAICSTLTSCGTASHYLGQATGLVSSITRPILGTLRLSDSPDHPAATPPDSSPKTKPPHDARPTPAKRRY